MHLPIVEVGNDKIISRKGVSAAGNAYDLQMQTAYLHINGSQYPQKVEIVCDSKDAEIFAPGLYLLPAESIEFRARDNRVEVKLRGSLIPLATAAAMIADKLKERTPAARVSSVA